VINNNLYIVFLNLGHHVCCFLYGETEMVMYDLIILNLLHQQIVYPIRTPDDISWCQETHLTWPKSAHVIWNMLAGDNFTVILCQLVPSLHFTLFQAGWYGAGSGCESNWSLFCKREELQTWGKVVKHASFHQVNNVEGKLQSLSVVTCGNRLWSIELLIIKSKTIYITFVIEVLFPSSHGAHFNLNINFYS
jgi:hypothetical protein